MDAPLHQPPPASWAPDTRLAKLHPYFALPVVEGAHQLSSAGQAQCGADGELSPGLDSCAVCASRKLKGDKAGTKDLLACRECQRVVYCCRAHQQEDQPHHAKVCHLLAMVEAADAIQVSEERERALLDMFPQTCQDLVPPPRDWLGVVPPGFARVWSLRNGSGGSSKSTTKSSKAAEPAPLSDGKARRDVGSGGARSQGLPQAAKATPAARLSSSSSHGSSAPSGSHPLITAGANARPAAASPDLMLAVELAVASSLLSYPLTLLQCLGTAPMTTSRPGPRSSDPSQGGGPAAAQAQPAACCASLEKLRGSCALRCAGSPPLVVCVLGASDTAELAQPQVWQVLSGLCPSGVTVQFVGPEVPAPLHGTVSHVGPAGAAGMTLAFFKGEYERLANWVLADKEAPPAPSERGPTESSAPQATSKKPSSPNAALLPEAFRLLPDVVVGFNMGLTCPDYSWHATLGALRRVWRAKCLAAGSSGRQPGAASSSSSSSAAAATGLPALQQLRQLPLVVTSNTFVEASFEDEVLLEAGWAVGMPIRANPFVSLELMQSGTLGNDVYRKNAWVSCYALASKPKQPAKKAGRGKAAAGGPGRGGGGKRGPVAQPHGSGVKKRKMK